MSAKGTLMSVQGFSGQQKVLSWRHRALSGKHRTLLSGRRSALLNKRRDPLDRNMALSWPTQCWLGPQGNISGQYRIFSELLKPNRAPKACTWPSQINARPLRPSKAPPRTTLVPLRPTVCPRLGRKGDLYRPIEVHCGLTECPLRTKEGPLNTAWPCQKGHSRSSIEVSKVNTGTS